MDYIVEIASMRVEVSWRKSHMWSLNSNPQWNRTQNGGS